MDLLGNYAEKRGDTEGTSPPHGGRASCGETPTLLLAGVSAPQP